ncbi:MAG TPA: hypothetical protein VFP54_09525 [Acidimicrobiales bacterium]|nr:hypothetical protein [Acidimicrobiales bacterium]
MSDDKTVDGRIGKSDIKAKLEQIRDEVDKGAEEARPVAIGAAAVAVVVVIALAYVAGRRRGRKGRTVVEVRRV